MGLLKKTRKFLFTDERKYPVVEFKSSADESLNIPSFILETTWPRILYFYYPNQSKHSYFHGDYVQIARHIRHESDILVLFYAVSCAAHVSMCFNSDLIQHPGQPLLKAYESGSTEGTEILIDRSSSSLEYMNDLVEQLTQILSLGSFENEITMLSKEGGLLSQSETVEDQGNESNNDRKLEDTYNDALTAFIVTLEHNIYGDTTTKVINGEPLKLSQSRSDILKDFLDLCCWALPPSWKIQEILHKVRSDFEIITEGGSGLESVLSNHRILGKVKWSERCQSRSRANLMTKGVVLDSYSCGLWNFLHILSIGINENRKKVMGDVFRIRPAYTAWVIRDFISEFIPDETNELQSNLVWCKGCKDRLIRSYDSCKQDTLCIDSIETESQFSNEASVKVSEWLWEIHKATESKSPIKKLNLVRRKFSYDELKKEYWSNDFVNVRIAVLRKIERSLPQAQRSNRTQNDSSSLFRFLVIVTCFYIIRRFTQARSKRGKRKLTTLSAKFRQ